MSKKVRRAIRIASHKRGKVGKIAVIVLWAGLYIATSGITGLQWHWDFTPRTLL